MSKLGAVFLAAAMAAAIPAVSPASAAEAPHRIAHSPAWGCRDQGELYNLLFLGISSSFDTTLAAALADGRCVSFTPGESVTILEESGHGIIKVQRGSGEPAVYWTPARNLE
jgi:hypothetical protein